MKKRSGFTVMGRLIGLVRPLTGYMLLAILMGLAGHLCASLITIFGGYAVLDLLGFETRLTLTELFLPVSSCLPYCGRGSAAGNKRVIILLPLSCWR